MNLNNSFIIFHCINDAVVVGRGLQAAGVVKLQEGLGDDGWLGMQIIRILRPSTRNWCHADHVAKPELNGTQ